jgi:hypothetical protein
MRIHIMGFNMALVTALFDDSRSRCSRVAS